MQWFRIKWTIVKHNVKHALWTKGLQKGDDPDSPQNLIITFLPIYNIAWNLHANSFRGICSMSTNYQAKSMWKHLINLLCAGNEVFVKYQAQGGKLQPSCERPWLFRIKWIHSVVFAVCRQIIKPKVCENI